MQYSMGPKGLSARAGSRVVGIVVIIPATRHVDPAPMFLSRELS